MATSLLDRALGGVQGQRGGAGNGGGSRRQSGGGRGSPYERPTDSWKHDKFASQDDDSFAPSKPAGGAGKGSLAARLSGAAGAGAGGSGARSNKLVIRNLHYEVSERELELLFVQIGPITAGPKIKFDRSGRSEGIAWVSYGSEEHAAQAKEAFNGAPAKGQPIEVEYDTRPDRASAGSAAGGAAASGSLLARLGGGNDAPRSKYAPPTSRPSRGGGRNERGVGSQGVSSRGAGGRGAARGGRNGGGRERKEPKTNEDLDRELEAFMKQPEGAGTKPAAGAPPALAAPVAAAAAAPAEATSGGDVEMS